MKLPAGKQLGAKRKIFMMISLIPATGVFAGFCIYGIMDLNTIILVSIGLGASFPGTIAGGAGLITVPAMMLIGIPVQTSIATNKFSSGIAAASSVFYLLHRKQVGGITILYIFLLALAGGIGGALWTSHLQEKSMKVLAFCLLCFALAVNLKSKKWSLNPDSQSYSINKRNIYYPILIAAYDGGFGPGSSTFSILYFMKHNSSYKDAAQLTRVLIFGSCAGGFIVFYQNGFIHWPYAVAMALGSTVGSQIGILTLPKIPTKIAKYLLNLIICLLIIQMLIEII
ncbi:sulfite exporter TauE/SafE family protein [Bacillus smithii]|uniref:sulfite exporter TauE/SafE family protein n=1 Tax=Bacillus smithii TaxID=1479 RepID=UPI003D25D82D